MHPRRCRRGRSSFVWLVVMGLAGPATAELEATSTLESKHPTRAQTAIKKGLEYLAATQQEDGGWEAFGRSNPAITALVVKAFIQDSTHGPEHPVVQRGLAFVLRFRQPDGGIYVPDSGLRNYHTSVALMALAATGDPTYREALAEARRFLKDLQWDEAEGHDRASTWHGGQGYGQHKRPDLSNTQLMLEALHQSGLSPDDPTYRKALVFVSRCQLLEETNDQDLARGLHDGGFIYTPVGGGESKAGTALVEGRPQLRSYGSMTYAGFKSMLYAGLTREDVRVQAAWDWIQKHYTLAHNPNMPAARAREGLYYYYHVFARALHVWGETKVTDAQGETHDWREELTAQLVKLQRPDGSWVNDEDRWYEGNPHLVSAYAILALQTTLETE